LSTLLPLLLAILFLVQIGWILLVVLIVWWGVGTQKQDMNGLIQRSLIRFIISVFMLGLKGKHEKGTTAHTRSKFTNDPIAHDSFAKVSISNIISVCFVWVQYICRIVVD
jgi:hypothetical protein